MIPIQEKTITSLGKIYATEVDLLRLDNIHPTISGNKWYKLQPHLARLKKGTTLVTMGGAFSNHLHATAFACHQLGIPCIGIVRSETVANPTLEDCTKWGMDLRFMRRGIYDTINEQNVAEIVALPTDYYFVPMGGFSPESILGTENILEHIDLEKYSHIVVSVGTGTTAIGISKKMMPHQELVGITSIKDQHLPSVLKENITIPFTFIQTQTLGGYGQVNKLVTDYIIQFASQHQILLDYTYTAKMMMLLDEQIVQGYIDSSDKILAIHTGGIQGNRGNHAVMERLAQKNIGTN